MRIGWVWCCVFFLSSCASRSTDEQGALTLNLRERVAVMPGEFKVVQRQVQIEPSKTALIVCDMWDDHWCKGAADRVAELAVALNDVVATARTRGVLIVHAPSTCMEFYADTPQRRLAQSAPEVRSPVPLSEKTRWGTCWSWPDPIREAPLPIDDSDMGCDCEEKCEIRDAWTRQISSLEIVEGDAITDNGQELVNLLALRDIEHVILSGVHLNMCVLGRPFGIREMVNIGKSVYLLRDMTDTMYNSKKAPYVSHFRGTKLVVEHVEKFWCPSFTSADIVGGDPFRFRRGS